MYNKNFMEIYLDIKFLIKHSYLKQYYTFMITKVWNYHTKNTLSVTKINIRKYFNL